MQKTSMHTFDPFAKERFFTLGFLSQAWRKTSRIFSHSKTTLRMEIQGDLKRLEARMGVNVLRKKDQSDDIRLAFKRKNPSVIEIFGR